MLCGRERLPRGYERGSISDGWEKRRVRSNVPVDWSKAGGGFAAFYFGSDCGLLGEGTNTKGSLGRWKGKRYPQ